MPKEYDGSILKAFLKSCCKVSSRLLSRLKLNKNGILLNDRHATVRAIVHTGDKVTLNMPLKENGIVPSDIAIEIVYEDENIIIFNKPPFMPVHPVREYIDNTLANAAVAYAISKGESYPFRALNRLDRDTSGCVVCVKNPLYASALKGHIKKTYIAVCEGIIDHDGTVNAPIALKKGSIMQREVNFDIGKIAITHYKVIKRLKNHTLLSLTLDTGRTHQIRVHMAHIGHPLAGDDMYGGSRDYIGRQALHCKTVVIYDPISGKAITADAPISEDIWALAEMFDTEN